MKAQALSAGIVVACASLALGAPRETISFTNQLSSPPPCTTGEAPTATRILVGGYSPKFLVLNGQLAAISSGTLPLEAQIQVFAPDSRSFTFQPFPQSTDFGASGTIDLWNYIVPIPFEVTDAIGTWTFRFSDPFNDSGATDDARWNSLFVTFDDGPPASWNLGEIKDQQLRRMRVPLGSNEVLWHRVTLPREISAARGTYLDIHTLGGTVVDTMIALYDAKGALVAWDDDDAGSIAGALTFGAGTRPPLSTGSPPLDGRDGPLASGTYYLAVLGFGYDRVLPTSWNVTGTSTSVGLVDVHLNANVTPVSTHIGTLTQDGMVLHDIDLLPQQILWGRFELANDAVAGYASYFLDIDTAGTDLPGSYNNNDTEIALYDAAGNLIAADDDGAGLGNLSLLSFGAGGRPPIAPGGIARDGQNGPLPAGAYYLAATAYNAHFDATDWAATTNHTRTGKLRINISTNTGGPSTCTADLDNGRSEGVPDGGVTIDDLLYFLLHFEAGC